MNKTTEVNLRCVRLLCLLALMLVIGAEDSVGQEVDSDLAAEDLIAGWQRHYYDVASGYRFQVGEDTPRDLSWVEKPVLTYTNPVRGRQQHGAIFVWTDEGRPAAMASIWSITNLRSPDIRVTAHELVSLSSMPLVATRPSPESLRPGVAPEWSVEDSGIKWRELKLPGSRGGELSASRAALQMRRLARRFRAELVTRSDRSLNQLRMLEAPIFQYETESKERVGGLFAFALATDPELFLWLEYRRSNHPQTEGKWRYGPVRMSLLELKLYLDDAMVWTEPDQKEKPNAAYNASFRVREFPAAGPPTSD